MKQLSSYIWRAVMMPALVMIAALVGLDCLFSFVHELDFLRGNYQAWQALQYVLTSIPHRISEFLPMAVLLGTLIGLGLLANSGELTVIRAAGVSTLRIGWMVFRPAILLLVLGVLNGEFVAPYAEQIAQSNRSLAESSGEVIRSKYGFWHREGEEFIHINAVQPNGVLYGLTRYRYRNGLVLAEASYVQRAIYQGDSWFLENVRGSRLGDGGMEIYHRDSGVWKTDVTPQLLSFLILDPAQLSYSNLYRYANYLQSQGLEAAEYRLSFWQKTLMPVATLAMVLIAISFVFGPLRQVTMGLRLTAGIFASLLFHYGQQFFGHLSLVFHTPPLLAALLPVLICAVIGVILIIRVR